MKSITGQIRKTLGIEIYISDEIPSSKLRFYFKVATLLHNHAQAVPVSYVCSAIHETNELTIHVSDEFISQGEIYTKLNSLIGA